MENFKKKSIKKEDIPSSDIGISVSELLSIVQPSGLANELFKLINIESIKDDFINIKGAKTLTNAQKAIHRKYEKIDLKSSLEDITFYSNKEFTLNFSNIDNAYINELNLSSIITKPIHSASREFFSELFQMDKYAASLISKGHKKILDANLEMLKPIHKTSKRYRILHDKVDNKFYLRAIISLSNYYNYDNDIAVVVGLLTLHNEMKKSGLAYGVKLCEYNESFIRILFESSEIKQLESIGEVRNIIEVSNDEVKREALRFTGACSIVFGTNETGGNDLYIRPQEIKSKILSVKHNQIPRTAIQELAKIENAKEVHFELFADIVRIRKITNPEQIKFLVKRKVEKAKNEEFKKFKTQILKELESNVTNIIQLLTIFKKLELLAGEDIDSLEYLRFIIYQALIKRK